MRATRALAAVTAMAIVVACNKGGEVRATASDASLFRPAPTAPPPLAPGRP